MDKVQTMRVPPFQERGYFFAEAIFRAGQCARLLSEEQND
jgi:hypothetical protein